MAPPAGPDDGYHLSEDLVDHALDLVRNSVSVRPDGPVFTYLAFGATHAPHQAPAAYLDRYRGRYDERWDAVRDRWFAQQQELGLLPDGTDLAPRNPGVEPWDEVSEDGRRLAARLQEAFAAFLNHTDDQIGRLVEGLRDLGRLDNTLLVVLSDNGASQEGGPFGVLHEMKFFNGILETPEEAVERLDEIGGPHSHTNYPWGWAQAGNPPFKWCNHNTHEGGAHVPLVVHWPARPGTPGGLRRQFHHVNDLAPTIYEATGVEAPDEFSGHEQLPVSGTSMLYSLDNADAPTAKDVQCFEMFGHRGLYLDGWKAVTRHDPGTDYDDHRLEQHHVAQDFAECHDLAEAEPERLEAMVERWWTEADEHGVLPLDGLMIELFGVRFRDHSPHPTDRHYTHFPPLDPIPSQAGAAIGGRSFDLIATVDRAEGDEGVRFATGTENAGVSLFVADNRLGFDYNWFGATPSCGLTPRSPSVSAGSGCSFDEVVTTPPSQFRVTTKSSARVRSRSSCAGSRVSAPGWATTAARR